MSCPHCAGTFGTIDTSNVEPTGTCDTCTKVSPVSQWRSGPPLERGGIRVQKRRRGDTLGMHGGKKKEQKRLSTTGNTHQSEHTIGYHVFAPTVPRGGSTMARKLENEAPAYQEELLSHRNHVGTGTSKEGDVYRDHQRKMVSDHQIGLAVQYNQLLYSKQPEFRSTGLARKADLEKADDSYYRMVDNLPPMPDATRPGATGPRGGHVQGAGGDAAGPRVGTQRDLPKAQGRGRGHDPLQPHPFPGRVAA